MSNVRVDPSIIEGVCIFCGEPTDSRDEPPRVMADTSSADDPLTLVRMCDDCQKDFEEWRAKQRDA